MSVSASARIRPFPWASLDSTSRRTAGIAAAARRWAARHVRLDAMDEVLGTILGTPVEVSARRLHSLESARPFGEGFACVLESASATAGEPQTVVIQVETALGAATAARLLRVTPPAVSRIGASPPALGGALAAIFVAAARRAHRGLALRVTAVGSALEIETAMARPPADWIAAEFTAILADDAYAVRVLLPRRLGASAVPSEWNSRTLAALGQLPIELCVVACALSLRIDDVASLRTGDALVPLDGVSSTTTGAFGWAGTVTLAPPSGGAGVGATLTEDGRLVLGGDVRSLDAAEAPMTTESGESGALVSTLGDVTVVVRVEIGEVRMTAREWAALGRGDVIALGARVGERVLLRVGGVPLARGDLIEIDGEIGVRIAERIEDTRVT
jgi:flagellar motor switch/type III secretory pathway protein FliN